MNENAPVFMVYLYYRVSLLFSDTLPKSYKIAVFNSVGLEQDLLWCENTNLYASYSQTLCF